MAELQGLTALIVEPHSGMRGNVHNMLNLSGINKVDHAISSGTAIKSLKNKTYDLIICEYDLGDGQDGQQLLEDLRHHKLIPLWTVFIIITAERAYQKVLSAAEFIPNDYVLKPFTADALLERIGRAVDKRTAFMTAYQMMEHGDLHAAIAACKAGEVSHRRYAADFMRLRAELHVLLGEATVAEPIYQQLAGSKGLAWARLGLAKTFFMQQKFDRAIELLTALVAENSKYMDAYDWLAKAYEAVDKLPAAKEVLMNAVNVSPHVVRRLRKLGEVAFELDDFDLAERSFQKVVAKAKYSEFRDPEDQVRLVQTLLQRDETQQAGTIVRDLEKLLSTSSKLPACRAIAAALLHTHNEDTERAIEELNTAVEACREAIGLSNGMKMELAKNCLANDLEEGAAEVMLDVMSNTPEGAAMAKAMTVFEQAGRKDLAQSVARESRRQVAELVSNGAEKAKEGDYRGAVDLMTAAVAKLPDNPQVVFNAAVAVLKYLENLGWDVRLGEQLPRYIETARRLDPDNSRLATLTEMHQTILKKYGITT